MDNIQQRMQSSEVTGSNNGLNGGMKKAPKGMDVYGNIKIKQKKHTKVDFFPLQK